MYSQFQRFAAIVLLFSLALQSCTSNAKLNYTPKEKAIKHSPIQKHLQGLKGGMESKQEEDFGGGVLHSAVRIDDIVTLRQHLELGADQNEQDNQHWTPLQWAATRGHREIVRLLLQQPEINVNLPNSLGNTPLHLAAEGGHTEIVELLLQNRANPNVQGHMNWTPLQWAATRGHTEIVNLLQNYNREAQEEKE